MNDPVTNTGGTGLAAVLLGILQQRRTRLPARAVHLRVIEHGVFVQDDFKVNSRLTINAGLRYEIFKAPTEEDNRLVQLRFRDLRLVYAGEDGTSRSVNKKTHYNNFAPRLGLTYDLTGDARTILRTGFGITYFPEPHSASQPARPAMCRSRFRRT